MIDKIRPYVNGAVAALLLVLLVGYVRSNGLPSIVSSNPIDASGYRVMILLPDEQEMIKMPSSQLAGIRSADTLAWLMANCEDGDFLIVPATAELENANPWWQTAIQRPRSQLPWILIGNGSTGYEGPVPETKDALLELLRKYK